MFLHINHHASNSKYGYVYISDSTGKNITLDKIESQILDANAKYFDLVKKSFLQLFLLNDFLFYMLIFKTYFFHYFKLQNV